MDRTPHEGMTAVAERLTAYAAEAASAAEQPERFQRLVNRMLEAVNMNLRIVIDESLKPAGTEPVALGIPRDTKNNYTLALRDDGSIYWDMTAKIMNEESYKDTSFTPAGYMHSPVATWINGTKRALVQSFGEGISPSADAIASAYDAENRAFNAVHPQRENLLRDLIENESQGLSSLTTFHLLTADLLRKRDLFSYKGIARLIAMRPEYEAHARLDVLNALRSHQTAMMIAITNLGLRELVQTDRPSEAAYFEILLRESRKDATALYRAMMEEYGTDEEKREAQMRTIDDMPPFDGDNAEDIALRAEKEQANMFAYFEKLLKGKGPPLPRDKEADARAFVDASNRFGNASTDAVKLKDAVGAEKHRAELADAREHHDCDVLAAKELEIIAAVMRELLRFEHSHPADRGNSADPASFTPAYVTEKKTVNCFTGPWLAAAMLLECGMKEGQLLYADVQVANDGQAGIHGSLVVALSSGQQMLLDVGHRKMRSLPFGGYDAKTKRKLNKLIQSGSSTVAKGRIHPVKADMSRTVAKAIGAHPVMHLMPMRQGFAWGTLLTMAMTDLEKGKIDDARHELELAHAMHPESPDVLCRLGMCALADGDKQSAKEWLKEALRCNPGHAMSLYQRALMMIDEGEYKRALMRLLSLPQDERKWFGGKKYVQHANTLRATCQSILQAMDASFDLRMQAQVLQETDNNV